MANTPRLSYVDPELIKFNPANPRSHQGAELLRLEKSIDKIGMVQLPTVRDLPGGFCEAIDGVGRILTARKKGEKSIAVVNLGIIDDREALEKLHAANSVRSYDFLVECRGLANLHRQGETIASLAEKFGGKRKSSVHLMVDVGYFPDDLFELMLKEVTQSEEYTNRWTSSLLREVLPLRQELPGIEPVHERELGETLDNVYDYSEVYLALQKVSRGEILNQIQMIAYVAQRRLELFQARFDNILQKQVNQEIELEKQAIEKSHRQELEGIQTKTIQAYNAKVKRLEWQLVELQKQHQGAIKEVAKRPEAVASLERELEKKVREAERERKLLQAFYVQAKGETTAYKQMLQKNKESELEEEKQKHRLKMNKELKEEKNQWEAYYTHKDEERQIKAEKGVSQAVAHSIETLSETQQSLLYILSPDMLENVLKLPEAEISSLRSQIRVVQDTLNKAEERLKYGPDVTYTDSLDIKSLAGPYP